jgi:small subunit ribosomal protein S8
LLKQKPQAFACSAELWFCLSKTMHACFCLSKNIFTNRFTSSPNITFTLTKQHFVRTSLRKIKTKKVKIMVNDTISDVLTRIRNGCLIQSQTVLIPLTKLSEQLCHTLQKEGFIDSFKRDSKKRSFEITLKYKATPYSNSSSARVLQLSKAAPTMKSCITNLRRISKPGLRVYTRTKQIPTVLGGMGILILSTSQGIMTDREARFRGIGGEVVCSVW